MTLLAAVARPLYGAYRLARLDAAGLRYFDTTHAAFWFSFLAGVLSLPLYLLLVSSTWLTAGDGGAFWRVALVELLIYVIAWVALPNVLPPVLRAINREHHFVRCVVVHNWAAVLQNLVYIPVATLAVLGVPGAGLISFMILLVVLFYGWYVIKNALDTGAAAAWSIILLDMLIGITLSLWSNGLIYG